MYQKNCSLGQEREIVMSGETSKMEGLESGCISVNSL